MFSSGTLWSLSMFTTFITVLPVPALRQSEIGILLTLRCNEEIQEDNVFFWDFMVFEYVHGFHHCITCTCRKFTNLTFLRHDSQST